MTLILVTLRDFLSAAFDYSSMGEGLDLLIVDATHPQRRLVELLSGFVVVSVSPRIDRSSRSSRR